MKTVYIFKCSTKNGRHGFTLSQDGSNLPKDEKVCGGQWQPFKTINISHDSGPLLGGRPTDILTGIENHGYHIIDVAVNFTEIAE